MVKMSLTYYDDLRGSADNITVLAVSVGEEEKYGSSTINRFDIRNPNSLCAEPEDSLLLHCIYLNSSCNIQLVRYFCHSCPMDGISGPLTRLSLG